MEQIGTDVEARFEYLRRLSVVLAFDLRIRIVSELYLREMSAKQFYEEFGGGSISRVDKHFKKLLEMGWLRCVRTETGGARRGAREHFYRAPEPAVLDEATWALVPYSMRIAFSWRTFEIFGERVRDALRAGTLDARADSHLSGTTMLVDGIGRERVMAATNDLFESICAEQEDARLRMSHSGEEPIVTTVALAAFESPPSPRVSDGERVAPRLVEAQEVSPIPFSKRASKVFADEISLKILAEANRREISAPQYHAEFGGDAVAGIRRRFKTLEGGGWLRKVGEKSGGRRRGARECFYRATGPAVFDREDWTDVPDSIGPSYHRGAFELVSDLVKEAMMAGTFEARQDNHLSWSVLRLDQRGWRNVAAAVNALFALNFKEWEAAEARIAESGEEPIVATVALAAFESPMAAAKEP